MVSRHILKFEYCLIVRQSETRMAKNGAFWGEKHAKSMRFQAFWLVF
jgi:hypothetical protein